MSKIVFLKYPSKFELNEVVIQKGVHAGITALDAFNKSYSKTAECWLWEKHLTTNGYGRFCFRRKWYTSHRLALCMYVGEVSIDKIVLHSCDNRRCVNPAHLRFGDHRENHEDAVSRLGWKPCRGEANGLTTLKEFQIPEIFALRKRGMTHLEISAIFGVSSSVVGAVLRKDSWRHASMSLDAGEFGKGILARRSKLTDLDILNICKLVMGGDPKIEIARKFGIHRKSVSRIIKRQASKQQQLPRMYEAPVPGNNKGWKK